MVSVSVTGLCRTPPSSHNSAMEMARVLSAISITSVRRVLDQRVCSMLVYYSQAHSQFLCMHVYFFFVITRRSVLSILISNLINKYSSLTLAPNMPCMLLVYVTCCLLQPHLLWPSGLVWPVDMLQSMTLLSDGQRVLDLDPHRGSWESSSTQYVRTITCIVRVSFKYEFHIPW